MADHIKRDSLLKLICERCNEETSDEPCEPSDCWIREVIMEAPADSVDSVVHCGSCKHYQPGEIFPDLKFCCRVKDDSGRTVRFNWSDDDYCSRGVKGEGDG